MIEELLGDISRDDLQARWVKAHPHTAKQPVGDKVLVRRSQDDLVEDEVFRGEDPDCHHDDADERANDMPTQGFQMLEEAHFIRIVLGRTSVGRMCSGQPEQCLQHRGANVHLGARITTDISPQYYTFAPAVRQSYANHLSMFDMFRDMEQKQQELQEKLAKIVIEHQSDDTTVTVRVDGNKEIRDVIISPALLAEDQAEKLQDLLVVTLNEAIRKAEARAMQELQSQFGDLLPDLNNFGSPFTA